MLSLFPGLKMETAWSSNTVVSYHITTLQQNPQDHDLNLNHHENLKSYMPTVDINWIFCSVTV